MTTSLLNDLESQACSSGLLLRIQIRRPLRLWAFKLVVAKHHDTNKIQLLGEMKGWAYQGSSGLQLDTMRVLQSAPKGVGHLIWASTMAWALEETQCKNARLLAILDDENQHSSLIRYFSQRGFKTVREVGSSPVDLPFRLVWGGAGSLMTADCFEVYKYSRHLWEINQ